MARQDLGRFSASNVTLVGGKVCATNGKASGLASDVQILGKSSPDLPKTSPGASKIEPGALQDVIFKILELKKIKNVVAEQEATNDEIIPLEE